MRSGSGTPAASGPAAEKTGGQSPSTERRSIPTLVFRPGPLGARPPWGPLYPALSFDRFGLGPFALWGRIPRADVYGSVANVPPVPLEGAPVGGLQLDVEPRRAQVYVDGRQAGMVDQFSGYYHHLDLAAGWHQIAIVEPGYLPLMIDVLISPGRTTTYRGTLMYAPGR
jgi:hypothetical protein